MTRDIEAENGPTRRDWIKYSGVVTGGGLLAGCLNSGGQRGEQNEGKQSTKSKQTGESGTQSQSSHSATIAPVGKVTFDSVPESVFTILTHHADMVLALGHGEKINAMHAPGYYQPLWSKFTDQLDGVSIDWEGLYSSWPPKKEKLYSLDSDVHLADPAKVATAEGWSKKDIEDIQRDVAPWFGNTLSSTHEKPPQEWADTYEYYTLWEIFERVAAVFKEEERYNALASIHSSMLDSFKQSLPSKSERPSAAMVLFSTSDDSMWGYELNRQGYYAAHTRPLGATDALVESFGSGFGGENGEIDNETLVEADPDVLLVLGPMSSSHNITKIRSKLKSNPVTQKITAVKEDRIYTQGARNQGPLLNLFQLEMTAKQLYPGQFGAWPGYENGSSYPSIPKEQQLFDRNRVSKIITDGVES